MSNQVKRNLSTTQPQPTVNLDLSPELAERLFFSPDAALKQGVHIMGGPGSGKTRFTSRVLIWQAFVRGLPTVVIDPTGALVDNIFDKLSRLPDPEGEALAERLVYVDAAAKDFVVGSPLYARHSARESVEEIANRLAAVLVERDPELSKAPMFGKNALEECASHAGQIAATLGLQISFVGDLIKHPNRYADVLTYAVNQEPDLQLAVDFFRQLADPQNRMQYERKTASFLNKLHPFLSDKSVRATFNAAAPGLDWHEVVRKGKTVLIDFRHEWDTARRQFKLLWWLKSFTLFAKYRGTEGRGEEVMLVIDELTQLLGYRTVGGESILAGEIEELTTAHARNFGINVVIAHQNLQQLDPRIQTALMQMGNQVIFRLANPDDAFLLARYFLTYDPYRVKKWQTQWTTLQEGTAWFLDPRGKNINGEPYQPLSMRSVPFPVDHTTTEFTPEEQFLMVADKFRGLKRFRFYLRPALAEGQIANTLHGITIENLDPGEYPRRSVRKIGDELRKVNGVPVNAVLADMAARTRAVLKEAKQARSQVSKAKDKPLVRGDKIQGETAHATPDHHLSEPSPGPDASEGSIWQPIQTPPPE